MDNIILSLAGFCGVLLLGNFIVVSYFESKLYGKDKNNFFVEVNERVKSKKRFNINSKFLEYDICFFSFFIVLLIMHEDANYIYIGNALADLFMVFILLGFLVYYILKTKKLLKYFFLFFKKEKEILEKFESCE